MSVAGSLVVLLRVEILMEVQMDLMENAGKLNLDSHRQISLSAKSKTGKEKKLN